MKTWLFLAVLAVTATASCHKNTGCDDLVKDPFEASVGQQINMNDCDFTLELLEISQDNRCPENATCITAGWVDTKIRLTTKDSSAVKALSFMRTNPEPPDSIYYAGYLIKITKVLPKTQAGAVIAQKDYRLTFTVQKK